jgi:glycerol kinase
MSNASRTLMMDLRSLSWDSATAETIGVPESMLPEIHSSSEVYGEVKSGPLAGIQIAGDLGDQQAATFGQTCFAVGEAKNTYGTGNFMLINTGEELVHSRSGLLTTPCYRIGDQKPVYALEGSIAITGALVQWLRDNLKMIKAAPEVEELASTVDDNGGLYIVPAFSGLYAPYWKSDARGVFAGLTRYVNAGHIARATLEATAYQSAEIVEAMATDSGVTLDSLKVDGGMVANETLMQFQADILGVPVIRPEVAETTALGAAYAAGLATGFWDNQEDLRENWAEDKRWEPQMDEEDRKRNIHMWKKAVTRTFDWVE